MNEVSSLQIMEWSKLQLQLAAIKKAEMELRKKIIADIFEEEVASKKPGTFSFQLGNGYSLKAAIKETTKIDEAALAAIEFPEGSIDKTVVWKASFSATGYKHLPENLQTKLQEALIIRPASPTLTLVEPKE